MTTMTHTALPTAFTQTTPLLKRFAVAFTSLRSVSANRAVLKDLLTREDSLLDDIGIKRRDIELALLNPMSDDAAVLLLQVQISKMR